MTYTVNCCDDGSRQCVGTIVRFDNVTILIDPGWSSSEVGYEDSMKYWSSVISEVDLILLSQPSVESLGAYAALYYNFLAHFITRIEVYATLPVCNLGRVTTIEWYVARGLIGPCKSNLIELADVEKAFDHIQALKYSQLADLRSKYDGLTLVAHNAGVSPGGSIWCISTYFEKLVYAVRWNHTRSTILNSSSLLEQGGKPLSALMRPSAFITKFDRFGSSKPHGKRVKLFKEALKSVLGSNGSAMIPVEIGGNFLDLFVLVHDFLYECSRSRLYTQVPVLLVSYSRGRALTYARSMLEWLSASLLKIWEARDNRSPFDLGSRFHVITPEELGKYSGPKICFVSQVDLLIDEVITKLCQAERTTIILTTAGDKNVRTLSALHRRWDLAQEQHVIEEGKSLNFSESMSLRTVQLKPITDKELEEYSNEVISRRDSRKELETSLQKEAKLGEKSMGAFNMEDSQGETIGVDDEDDEDEDNLLSILKEKDSSTVVQSAVEIPVDFLVQPGSHSKHKMFPFQPARIKADDYGTVVDFTSMFSSEDGDLNGKNDSAMEGLEEDEDPYELSEERRELPKKPRRETKRGKGKTVAQSFDNIDYLDPLQNPVNRTESTTTVTVKCSLIFVNLESLADQRSTSVILPALKPRKALLLGPQEAQNSQSVNTLQKRDVDIIEMPLNKPIEFVTSIKSIDISIDPELDSLLKWQRIGDNYTVAHVIGRLVKEKAQANKGEVSKPQTKRNQNSRTKLVLKPLQSSFKAHTGGSLSIGDIRLADLKRRLTDQHHRAEFKGEGTLVVDGQVAVRKISDSETIVDGSPSELFYSVKNAITEMLAKI
ncbi:hypothetical protein HG537_0H01470 [Torulaspora globosa]|uniref:Cleavage and polyadenylation specificity factor subunit 2 n=1 Tax=Torulaspora globosa TaxID=48254 RepID=A0A7H9I0I6_9SACH|nr:hypothetical protein HG537_0H01470 [Torulaspora sp. CBS 2947]